MSIFFLVFNEVERIERIAFGQLFSSFKTLDLGLRFLFCFYLTSDSMIFFNGKQSKALHFLRQPLKSVFDLSSFSLYIYIFLRSEQAGRGSTSPGEESGCFPGGETLMTSREISRWADFRLELVL